MKVQLMFASVFASAAIATAQTTPTQPDQKAPAAQPSIAPAPAAQPAGQPTLIRHDANGKIIRPDVSPDEAALELLDLDAGEKEAVNQLLTARHAILDQVIADNLRQLDKFLGIDTGDTQKERMQALKELITKTSVRDMGSVHDHVAPLLAPQKAATYNDILSTYWAAITQEDQSKTARGKPMTPEQIRGMETMLAYGGEITRSYERLVEAKADQLGAMVSHAKPTPEQDAKIKALISAYTEKAQGKPTASQKRDVFRSVLKELDFDQRQAMLAELYGVTTDGKKPEEKAPEKKPDEKK
jgi:hypothetical protein